jgi:AcrR family transcriptional regulator
VAVPTSTARPKRVRLEHDVRRRQILAAARRLFDDRPYSQISMHELAQEAGVARGLLHHYFGSKRDLYLAVVRDLVRVPSLPVPEGAAGAPVEEVWAASVDGWMALMEANRELYLGAVRAGVAGRDPELEAILEEARELLAGQVLAALGYEPEEITPELQALVRGYSGLAEEVTREWLDRGRLSREQARRILRQAMPLLLDQVLPEVAAARG